MMVKITEFGCWQVLKCSHYFTSGDRGLHVGGNAPARWHQWLKLLADAHERIGHRNDNLASECFGMLADHSRHRIPRRGYHHKVARGRLGIVAARHWQRVIGPVRFALSHYFVGALASARTKHDIVAGDGKAQTQSATGRASATDDSDTHPPSLTQTARANYG